MMITILVLTASKRLLYIWIYSASTFNPYESFSSTVVTTGKTQIKKTAGWKVKVNKLNKTAGRKVKVDKTLALSPQLLHPPGLHLPGFRLLSSSLVQVTQAGYLLPGKEQKLVNILPSATSWLRLEKISPHLRRYTRYYELSAEIIQHLHKYDVVVWKH